MNISTACVLRSSGTIFQTTKHTDHVSTPCVAKMVWKHIPDKERLTTCLMLTYGHFCEIIVWKHFPDKQRYYGWDGHILFRLRFFGSCPFFFWS
jgi:hypothetical protein